MRNSFTNNKKEGEKDQSLCEYCKGLICPPSCPNYTEDPPTLFGVICECFRCGRKVFRGEAFQYRNNEFFCGKCAALAHLTPRFS